MNYVDEARKRWPGANVIGEGRFACIAQNGRLVYLAVTEQQARNIGLGVDHPKFENLHNVDLDRVRDVYDPEEARRERRAKKAEANQ